MLHCKAVLDKGMTHSALAALATVILSGELSLTWRAGDAVIVTASLGALKRKNIQFSPALPERKLGAIRRLGFGVLNKARHASKHLVAGGVLLLCCLVSAVNNDNFAS